MLKIAFPAWSMSRYDWDRFTAVLEPLSKHALVQVYYFADVPAPEVEWCSFRKVPHPPDLLNATQYAMHALNIIKELDDFDLLYCWSSGAYFQLLNVLTGQLANRPVVMHVNGDAALSRKHHLPPVNALLENAVDQLTLNNVDALVPISSILHKAIRPRIKNPERLFNPVPFSVDPEAFRPLTQSDTLTVGYAGRLSPEKGTPFLFDLIRKTPDVHYRVAGPIQMDITFPDNCHYFGCLPLNEMVHFYNLCDVIVLPSYGEGLPAAVIEAYACGRPVIVTPESLPDELKLFGWKLPLDLEQWQQTISSLDLVELRKLGSDARQWITQAYPDWACFAKRMDAIFRTVVAQYP